MDDLIFRLRLVLVVRSGGHPCKHAADATAVGAAGAAADAAATLQPPVPAPQTLRGTQGRRLLVSAVGQGEACADGSVDR